FERIQAAVVHVAGGTVWCASYRPWHGSLVANMDDVEREQAAVAGLVREVFGSPVRPARLDPSRLRWHDGTIPRIAQGIYEERAFDRLPVLHDALLDAGCDDEAILAHCRGAGLHVRGCWVIDLILGKS